LTELESVVAGDTTGTPGRKPTTRRILLSLGLALIIVAAAWFVAGRQGLDTVGQGGVNQKLLPRAGEPAPDVTVTDILGNQVTLSSLKGNAVWLNFWGSWCPPCRAEMPEIQAAYEQLEPDGIKLLAISLNEPPIDAALFAARNNVTFPIFTDQYQTATGAEYPIYNFPTHIFIDPNGIVSRVVLSEMSTAEAVGYARDAMNSDSR
jgi:peroxiredoxin